MSVLKNLFQDKKIEEERWTKRDYAKVAQAQM